jgi:glycosyltransferase involved in cell wall biosynthesis
MYKGQALQAAWSRDERDYLPTSDSSLSGPRLSVVVPVWNGELGLARCLEALTSSTYKALEIVVVDDCSTDATARIAREFDVRYIRSSKRLGPANARNIGARNTIGDILVFVDADVVLPADGLQMIADDFERNPQVAAVFGSYDDAPDCPAFFSQYKNLVHHYIHQASRESASTFWAGCGAMRKTVFQQFGGFDAARYKEPTIEDVALGMEISRSGHPILLEKRLLVKHLKRWTFFSLVRTDILHRAVPWTRLILNTRNLPNDLNFDKRSRASLALVAALTASIILLALSPLQPWRHIQVSLTGAALACACFLLFINRRLYKFFVNKRGWWFAARAVFAHWFYFLYGGMTLAVVSVDHWTFGQSRRPKFSVEATASIKRDIT